jgi:CHAT domain-containing protein
VFVQKNASEEILKQLSGKSPSILHIATHGFFLPASESKINLVINPTYEPPATENPLFRSGIILSGANYFWKGGNAINGVEDGICTAYEISQLDLSKTELVVLSACETGLGDVKGSEGVFGLQRGFKLAGAQKMIVSLWQVPDKETAELMTALYSEWIKGKSIETAFYHAQTLMRNKYAPFYWAAFTLVE